MASNPSPAVRLFILSFTALFLELMLIRWVPTTFRLVAYYANLMLISSFLGLGLGALTRERVQRVFTFPVALAALVVYLSAFRGTLMPGQGNELRFFAVPASVLNHGALIGLFLLNVGLFVPLGRAIGAAFHDMPPLRAYAWDLAGALCGTIGFGLFSFFFFSPVVGMTLVLAAHAFVARGSLRWWEGVLSASVLAVMIWGGAPGSHWSPYHHITVVDLAGQTAAPPPALRSMQDPPIYKVRVNQDFYQLHGTLDPARYTSPPPLVGELQNQYLLPYAIKSRPQNILVVGAGGGMDVETALMVGAAHVDAVEIDPLLVRLSRRFNASGVFDDPRVRVHVDDARAFLHKARGGYDAVVYGFLDSQALFSSLSNVRLDGFVYTVEGLRAAHRLLKPGGLLVLSFFVGNHPWLADKLVQMLSQASGQEPVAYASDGKLILCVANGPMPLTPPASFGRFQRVYLNVQPSSSATDDWPYLYLAKKEIPRDYLLVIGALLAVSLALLFSAQRGNVLAPGLRPFFFLGFGFLLLQTKGIVDGSLYFGATWLTTTLLVAGLLLMALAANAAAQRFSGPPARLFIPLLAALAALVFFPRETALGWPLAGRFLWMLLAVPLPAFFAGMAFSTGLRNTDNPSAALGANLVGATLGGFSEYLGMAVGGRSLSWLLVAAYLAALLSFLRFPQKGSAALT